MDQDEYDNWTQHLYRAVDQLMEIGNDDPIVTANDIREMVDRRIAEAGEE